MLSHLSIGLLLNSAKDPINFDADPGPDPGSALGKKLIRIWVLRVNFFLQFLVDIFPLGSGSVDPHIFADPDPDPGSKKLADPTYPDPDSKLCF